MQPETLQHLYTPGCIRTYSGHYLDILNPQPEHICIEDIAHALAHQPRWAGHTPIFYSVAAHSLACAHMAPPQHKLAALLHDASEAYLCDMPSPIKALMPQYSAIENRLMAIIAQKFGFAWPISPEVKAIDKQRLEWEWMNIKLGHNPTYAMWSPEENKANFIARFEEYRKLAEWSKMYRTPILQTVLQDDPPTHMYK